MKSPTQLPIAFKLSSHIYFGIQGLHAFTHAITIELFQGTWFNLRVINWFLRSEKVNDFSQTFEKVFICNVFLMKRYCNSCGIGIFWLKLHPNIHRSWIFQAGVFFNFCSEFYLYTEQNKNTRSDQTSYKFV